MLDGVDASKQHGYFCAVEEKRVEYSKSTGTSRERSALTRGLMLES